MALQRPLLCALSLSLGTAIALGLARFSYALLLGPMRTDLGWSYLLAGGMNTANALGYFLGALLTPVLLRKLGNSGVIIGGALASALFMLLPGLVQASNPLLLFRLLAGMASATIFIGGGVLASRLASLHTGKAGLLLGLFYGGTGLGISLSALLLPPVMAMAPANGAAHGWQWAWMALALLCLLCTAAMFPSVRLLSHLPVMQEGPAASTATNVSVTDAGGWTLARMLAFALAGYFMFGVGYIGYMTFIVAMLREQGMTADTVMLFYTLLGVAVLASPRIWAGMLDKYKGGQALAILNGLLGLATLLPVLSAHAAVVFVSGLMFGGIFLSAVASTTALVRHNLPQASWPAGIAAFTTAFASGQVLGPTITGWIADGAGGLQRGLAFSALALLLGALLAWRQRALMPS
jgi:predicted MFS family arabinose efflux permease